VIKGAENLDRHAMVKHEHDRFWDSDVLCSQV